MIAVLLTLLSDTMLVNGKRHQSTQRCNTSRRLAYFDLAVQLTNKVYGGYLATQRRTRLQKLVLEVHRHVSQPFNRTGGHTWPVAKDLEVQGKTKFLSQGLRCQIEVL